MDMVSDMVSDTPKLARFPGSVFDHKCGLVFGLLLPPLGWGGRKLGLDGPGGPSWTALGGRPGRPWDPSKPSETRNPGIPGKVDFSVLVWAYVGKTLSKCPNPQKTGYHRLLTKSRLWTVLGGSLPDPSRRGSRPVLDGRPDRVLRPPPDAILPARTSWEARMAYPPQTTLPPSLGGVLTHTCALSGGPAKPALPWRASKPPFPEPIPNQGGRKPGFQTHPKPHPLLGPSKVAPNLDPNLVSDRTP